MQLAAIAVATTALLIDLLTHRFQRAALAVANLHTEGKGSTQEIARLQMAMMPDWIGHLGLLERLLAIIAAVLLYLAFSWWGLVAFGVVYLLGLFAGIVGYHLPLMPYPWNLSSIEKHLERTRLTLVVGQRLPIGATTDLDESMTLSYLARQLREDFSADKISVERIAAGYVV